MKVPKFDQAIEQRAFPNARFSASAPASAFQNPWASPEVQQGLNAVTNSVIKYKQEADDSRIS